MSKNGLVVLPIRLMVFGCVPLAFSSVPSDGDFFFSSSSLKKKTQIEHLTISKQTKLFSVINYNVFNSLSVVITITVKTGIIY